MTGGGGPWVSCKLSPVFPHRGGYSYETRCRKGRAEIKVECWAAAAVGFLQIVQRSAGVSLTDYSKRPICFRGVIFGILLIVVTS